MVAFMLVFTVYVFRCLLFIGCVFSHFGQLVFRDAVDEFMVAFVLVFTVFRTTVNSDFVFPSIA